MALQRLTSALVTFMTRTLHSKLRDTMSILDYEKSVTEEARWASAIEDLCNRGGGTLIVPAGVYVFTGSIAVSVTKRVQLKFQPGAILHQFVDADLFNIVTTTSGAIDFDGPGEIIAKFGNMSQSSAAIRFQGTSRVRSFVCTGSLQIHKDAASGSQFYEEFHLIDGQDCVIRDVISSGLVGEYHGRGIYITAINNPSVSWTIDGVDSYDHEIGVYIEGQISPGVEGVKAFNCDWVGCKHGIHWVNESAYFPPQLEVFGCHINSRGACILLKRLVQVHVIGGLYYRRNSDSLPDVSSHSFFMFDGIQDMSIVGASLSVTLSSMTLDAITLKGTGAFGRIDGNHFWMNQRNGAFIKMEGTYSKLAIGGANTKDTDGAWINLDRFTGNHTNIQISSDLRLSGRDWSTIGNVHVDASSGVVDLSKVKRGMLYLSNVDSNSVITGFSNVEVGRMITIQCDVAGVTISRSSSVLLRDTGDFKFSTAGDTITLISTATNTLREVSRSNPSNVKGSLTMTSLTHNIAAGGVSMIATGIVPNMGVGDGVIYSTSQPHSGFILNAVKEPGGRVSFYATNIGSTAAGFPSLSITTRAVLV